MLGTTVFLAGGEVETLTRALVDNGVRWILLSYYYILAFGKEAWVSKLQDENPQITWFLDSGAFTYANQIAAGKKLPNPQKYVRGFFDYVQETGHRWSRIAEPDLDGIDGLDVADEQVEEWLEEMLTRFPDYPVMPTYHGWRGPAKWTSYCQDPRIKCLAIGRGTRDIGIQRKLVLEARTAGKPVHGFAMTKFNTTLKTVPYDSVDSTSVWMGQKYGSIYIFMHNKWRVLVEKPDRRKFRKYFTSIGCNPDLIEKDDVAEVRRANVIAWRNLSERFHTLKERRDNHYGMGDAGIGREEAKAKPAVNPLATRRIPLSRPLEGGTGKTPPMERGETPPIIYTAEGTPIVPTEVRKPRPLARFGVPIDDPNRPRARPKER